jgi:predicted Zn-dependent protease with MMP-like domain
MVRVSEEEFQEMMESSMESIPDVFKNKMENIAFLIEPYPTESDFTRVGLKEGSMLLGLYSGTPYTHRSTWYAGTTPDRIILFQKNIEAVCSTKDELKAKIREVVIHEIAHYFGMNEEEIRNAGY